MQVLERKRRWGSGVSNNVCLKKVRQNVRFSNRGLRIEGISKVFPFPSIFRNFSRHSVSSSKKEFLSTSGLTG